MMSSEGVASGSGRKRSAETDSSKQTSAVVVTNSYCGYQPPAGIQMLTERIPASTTAENFFTEYISKRRPAVFDGSLTDEDWMGNHWTVEYLSHKAGNATVAVENQTKPTAASNGIDATSATFLEMQYHEFALSLSAGETGYQLTNSDMQCSMSDLRDRCGYLSTVLQPLHSVADEFPLRPNILGNLVPHQVSLCEGHCDALHAPSSNLRHHFHDCLLVLVRGHLRFRLFPPSVIPVLRSSRCSVKIHANGLAVYLPAEKSKQKSACVRADGVPLIGVARMKRDEAERNLMEAEARVMQLRNAGADSNPALSGEMQEAMRVMADCELNVDVASDELQRYYSDYDDDRNDDDDDDVISIHDDDSEPETTKAPASKQSRLSDDATAESGGVEDKNRQEDEVTMLEYWRSNCYHVALSANDTTDTQVMFAECPELRDVACLVADVRPGQMIYLPASWLYEVSAFD